MAELSLIETGLFPTSDVPATKEETRPPSYIACPKCERKVLRGETQDGVTHCLDTDKTRQQTYCIVGYTSDKVPQLRLSQSYVEHRC